MDLARVVEVSCADAIYKVRTLPLAHGRAKMHWTRPFWRTTTSPLSANSYDLTFESTELSRARLGPQTVRNSIPRHFYPIIYPGSYTR